MPICQALIDVGANPAQDSLNMWTWALDGTAALDAAISRSGQNYTQIGRAIGVSGSLVSRWCSGGRKPDPDQLAAVCRYLGVSADPILGLKPADQSLDDAIKRAELLGRELQAFVDRVKGR